MLRQLTAVYAIRMALFAGLLIVLSACGGPVTPAAQPASTPASAPTTQPTPATQPTTVPAAQGAAAPAAENGRYGGTPAAKLSQRLTLLMQPEVQALSAVEQAQQLSLPETGPGSLRRDTAGRIMVVISVSDTSEAAVQTLKDAGASVVHVAAEYGAVTAYVGPDKLAALTALATVKNVREELAPGR